MLNNFIPTIWSAKILSALKKALVYGQSNVVNRDYEGEIRDKGDSVKINSIGDVTIKDHEKNTDIDGAEELNDGSQMLNITEGKYFNCGIDDVDKAQTNVNVMSEAMERAAYGLRDKADQFIAGHHIHVPASNLLGSDGAPITISTPEEAYEYLVELGVRLDEANAPTEGRFAIIPSWYHGLMLKDDRFVGAGTAKTDVVLANGHVGEAAGFALMKSNNVPSTAGTLYKIIAGHRMGFSYAEQIVKVEAYRPERRFSDAVKGLHVYGGKLVRPYCWAVLTANKS